MEINFIGGAYAGRSKNLNAQVCQNLFVVIDQEGGKSVVALMGTPGLKNFSVGGSGEVRGMLKDPWNGSGYAVIGNTLYRVGSDGTATSCGTIGTTRGRVYLAAGTTHLMVVDNVKGYYSAGGALTEITDDDFPTPQGLAYVDGFFMVGEQGTDLSYVSDEEDASSWDPLAFAAAEDQPDDLVLPVAYNRYVWMLGKRTSEIFQNSGDTTYPFTRVAGAVQPIGVGAEASIASGPEGLFWLDHRYQVRMAVEFGAVKISTSQIDYQISQFGNQTDLIGYVCTWEGFPFYVLIDPGAPKTFIYSISTGIWQTLSSGLFGGRHRSNCAAWWFGKSLVGDYQNGKILEYDMDTFTDDGVAIRRVRVSPPVQSDRRIITHHRLEIEFEAGVGSAQAMLDWSDDGGHTWSNEYWRNVGATGEYDNMAVWDKLGSARSRIYRLTMTGAVKWVIIGAHLEASIGLH